MRFGEVGYPALGGFDGLQVWAGDGDNAFVVDVELGAGFCGDAADGFAALADDLADEFGVDLHLGGSAARRDSALHGRFGWFHSSHRGCAGGHRGLGSAPRTQDLRKGCRYCVYI